MKAPLPGARRYFFVPSADGAAWELAEAAYRRGAWDVAYPGQVHRDRFEELPPPKADWVEMVPPGRGPKREWPPKAVLARPTDAPPKDPVPAPPRPVKPAEPKAASARPPAAAKQAAIPRKAIPRMSRELADLMVAAQKDQKAPPGKAKCPQCGAILEPTRNQRVRTHDDPLTGGRCDASARRWDAFGKPRPPRPRRGA